MTPARLVISVLCWCAFMLTSVPAGAVTYPEGIGDGSSKPWVVAIRTSSGELVCSGTMIAPRVVLTAAHCIDGVPKNVRIHSGNAQPIGIDGYARHPSYKAESYRHDIGLIHLSSPLVMSFPSLSPTKDTDLFRRHGENLQVLGWGVSENGTVDDRLRWTSQRDISSKGAAVMGPGFDRTRMVAAGRWEPRLKKYSGACKGDSGGPLLTPGEKPVVVGVVSFGARQCSSKHPTVYTRVGAYRKWIVDTMRTLSTARPVVVDITVVGGRNTMVATVTGAGNRSVELRCDRTGSAPLVAVIGEGSSKLSPVVPGNWQCVARPAGTSGSYSPIGLVEVR